ncbi:T9SS type A sorting domain-containing protein [Mucilaginibacter terrigena]|uniref:T9SS type A sorting domain-containing protein n=1 Tax=Mucilaginibacter terrigena TaxID=2492395 RepID=A0A4Q5LN78_9SPHI|nr:S8 family serine peptidase [Mucilaginibacter terrigena]RYU90745.1 T9SS type A sorting domain-containing protein [Mucilaginibacter terrigena]
MGKRYPLLFIYLLLTACTMQVFAQKQIPINAAKQKKLDSLSLRSAQDFTTGHQKAVQLAPSKGWAIRRVTKAGNLVALQGVNNLGFPVFLITHNNTIAAATTGTNTVQPGGALGLNLNGSSAFLNNKLGIWDGGQVYKAHREFAGKTITAKDNADVLGHSTHVAGTMIAKGVYAPVKGMAYGANTLQAWDFDDDVTEMSASASGLLLSNHSYGDVGGWDYNSSDGRWEWYGLPGDNEDYNFGFYDSRVQSWDKIAYNAPYYLIVESAGNSRSSNGPAVGSTYYGYASRTNPTFVNKGPRPANISSNNGYDIITTTGNAKNILTVGSVGPVPNGPVNRADVAISFFSSWGPTDDGRIKPDIVGDGENVTSTGIQGTSSYLTLSGTSMAAPNVTGSLYLLQEYYAQKNGGNFMRSATLKGLACHTAFDAGNIGPDYIYGWGLLDMRKAAQAITDNGVKSIINEATLTQGQTKTFEVVASGVGPLSVTISWTDPEGTPTQGTTINDRTPKLVNDLDLRLGDGAVTFSPWVLTPDNPSANATTGDNIRDNIEQVYIANAVPGKKYTVTVSHKGTLRSGSQPYSVIVTGAGGNPYCASAPTSTADSKITKFSVSNINYTAPAGCTGYTDNTNLSIQLEAGKTYPFSLALGTCGANFNKAAKIFIDWNGNGDFDTDELVETTGVIAGTSTVTGNIAVPATVAPGNISLLRIVLNETTTPASIAACGTYNKGETQDYRIQFIKPAVDAGVIAVVNSDAGVTCATAVAVTVRLKNFGSTGISNIPVTVTVTSPNNTVTTLNETYTGSLSPEEETDFTFSSKFNAVAGATYSITAETNLAGDPIVSNNKATGTIAIGFPPEISGLLAYFCTNTNAYQLSGSGDGELLWYRSATDAIPVGYGSPATVITEPINNTFYAGLNDFSGKVGPANKNVFAAGGYNEFTPGVKINTKIPVTIESARLYIGNPGKITFTATNDNGEVVSSVTLNVRATSATAQPGDQPNDPTDQGKVYTLNLLLPAAGNYVITPTYENGATIYRNNGGVTGYPFTIGNIFSITGNDAISDQSETDTTYYKNFYYYLYDMQVRSPGCASAQRVPVTVTKPVITQNGDVLNSSIATGNQWLLNGVVIDGAVEATYTPLVSGNYQVQVTLDNGCTALSDVFAYALIAKNPDKTTDIGLTIFPVPANTYFNVLFEAKAAGNLQLSLVNSSGQIVYQISQKVAAGNFSTVVNTVNRLPGTYILKINLGDKLYSRKIIITK